jgi:ribonuclease-3
MFRFFGNRHKQEDKELLKFLRNILGCKPKNISIYRLSLVHRSRSHVDTKGNKLNNERLEYLGDTVLSTIVGEYLFKKYPHKGEGFLTEMRSKMVSRSTLNKLSSRIGLSDLIKYSRGGLGEGQFLSLDGNAFEALVGALYLDKGYNFTYKTLTRKLFMTYMDIDELENTIWNYKGKLIAWGQKNKCSVSFETIEVEEINHRKQYTVQVNIGGAPYEKAINYSIKSAEQLAAEKAYKKIIEEKPKEELYDTNTDTNE